MGTNEWRSAYKKLLRREELREALAAGVGTVDNPVTLIELQDGLIGLEEFMREEAAEAYLLLAALKTRILVVGKVDVGIWFTSGGFRMKREEDEVDDSLPEVDVLKDWTRQGGKPRELVPFLRATLDRIAQEILEDE